MSRRHGNRCSPCKPARHCPPSPPPVCTPCARAYDDAFIRSIFAAVDALDAAAFAAFFAVNGVEDLITIAVLSNGRAAIEADNASFFSGLQSAQSDVLSITRLVDDCNVIVAVELNFTFVGNGTGFIPDGTEVFGNHTVYLTINPSCEITLYQDFVRFERTTPPT